MDDATKDRIILAAKNLYDQKKEAVQGLREEHTKTAGKVKDILDRASKALYGSKPVLKDHVLRSALIGGSAGGAAGGLVGGATGYSSGYLRGSSAAHKKLTEHVAAWAKGRKGGVSGAERANFKRQSGKIIMDTGKKVGGHVGRTRGTRGALGGAFIGGGLGGIHGRASYLAAVRARRNRKIAVNALGGTALSGAALSALAAS